jgi:hypothetical protein
MIKSIIFMLDIICFCQEDFCLFPVSVGGHHRKAVRSTAETFSQFNVPVFVPLAVAPVFSMKYHQASQRKGKSGHPTFDFVLAIWLQGNSNSQTAYRRKEDG